ncbi:conserved membrane hypothetical protein [Hyella patelloides LEGE 07179]|uniref:Yip1 domain-containing protein n=1 Tax=Hyella patelloides LEGE 07179 TaxID=945734 RepID=A0A563W4U8_9CYAN|nr:hypothetical protein [Hyella patelloides]VEP18708.1 conserved membrane hypothetical protein [Hyella patelloides LEGE 07179]
MLSTVATVDTAINRFWDLISGVLCLNPATFESINNLPLGLVASILVVLLAGMSQTLGQGAMLFINRVKPLRFFLSVAVAAVLFVFNYNFWVLSTWLVAGWLFSVSLPLVEVVKTLGFSYSPLLLGFLMVIPYFGMPILIVLSIWTLLAIAKGLGAISDLGIWQAFECCLGGWLVLQFSQRVLGKAIANITNKIIDWVAGVQLITEANYLEQMLYSGLPIPPVTSDVPNLLGDSPKQSNE